MDRVHRALSVVFGAFHLPHEVFQAGQFSADGRQIRVAGLRVWPVVIGVTVRLSGVLRKGQRMVVLGRCLRRGKKPHLAVRQVRLLVI